MADEQKLIDDVKNYLDRTWQDDMEDQKITGIVKRGMAAITGKIGECNFYEETQERALLFDYVMYAMAGEIPQFWQNYSSEILSLQIDRRVESYDESEES